MHLFFKNFKKHPSLPTWLDYYIRHRSPGMALAQLETTAYPKLRATGNKEYGQASMNTICRNGSVSPQKPNTWN